LIHRLEGRRVCTLRESMRMIQREGRGAIVYLRPQWSGEGWRQELQTPFETNDEDRPHKSVSSTMVEYGTGSQILRLLGLSKLRLITNSQAEYPQLDAFGLQIVERVPVAAKDT
jgi:3,4-dihydroxy 2-butanone 4-phosphate synthase/GTP cyclohydrolase II